MEIPWWGCDPSPTVRWNTQNLGWKQPLTTAPACLKSLPQVHKQASWEAQRVGICGCGKACGKRDPHMSIVVQYPHQIRPPKDSWCPQKICSELLFSVWHFVCVMYRRSCFSEKMASACLPRWVISQQKRSPQATASYQLCSNEKRSVLTNQKSPPSFRAATRVSFQFAGPHVLQYVKLRQ